MTLRAPPAVNSPPSAAAAHLLTAAAIRQHCTEVAREAIDGRSALFRWREDRLPQVAAYVVEVIRERYPDLRVPIHSRWRHIEAGGIDRWATLCALHGLEGSANALERARSAVDLVIPSVLLDAGAGSAWRYSDAATRRDFTRSEGLAIASVELFESGRLSADPARAAAQRRRGAREHARRGHRARLPGEPGQPARRARGTRCPAVAPG
jgi:hypothetical protein